MDELTLGTITGYTVKYALIKDGHTHKTCCTLVDSLDWLSWFASWWPVSLVLVKSSGFAVSESGPGMRRVHDGAGALLADAGFLGWSGPAHTWGFHLHGGGNPALTGVFTVLGGNPALTGDFTFTEGTRPSLGSSPFSEGARPSLGTSPFSEGARPTHGDFANCGWSPNTIYGDTDRIYHSCKFVI